MRADRYFQQRQEKDHHLFQLLQLLQLFQQFEQLFQQQLLYQFVLYQRQDGYLSAAGLLGQPGQDPAESPDRAGLSQRNR